MNKTKAAFAFLLVLSLCFSARAESTVASLIDAAEKLAFETDNVTITGKAEFLLDGKRFKTAEITYVQDGYNSFWQEKLRTPKEGKEDLESGFTIIQNSNEFYVMEMLNPGIYKRGFDQKQSTLLRRSPMADLLFLNARTVAKHLEPFCHSLITAQEQEDGSVELRLSLTEENDQDDLSFLANLGMRFIGKRLFRIDSDKLDTITVNELTEAKAILYYTKDMALKDCSVSVSLDASGRLTSISGTINAQLTSYTFQELESTADNVLLPEWYTLKDRLFSIRFDAVLAQYGESVVKLFDPGDYQVRLPGELTSEQQTQMEQRCREISKKTGVALGELTHTEHYEDYYSISFGTDNDLPCFFIFTEDGLLYYFQSVHYTFDGYVQLKDGLTEEQKQKTIDFLHTVNPSLDVADLTAAGQQEKEETRFLDVHVINSEGTETRDIILKVCVKPEWRIAVYENPDLK